MTLPTRFATSSASRTSRACTEEARNRHETAARYGSAPFGYESMLAPASAGGKIAWMATGRPDGYRITARAEVLAGGKAFSSDLP